MYCKYKIDGDCCNRGATQYMCKCKKPCCDIIPLTKGDRIRAMSDEVLADWVARTQIANVAEVLSIANIPWHQTDNIYDETKKECLNWLTQPAEEGADNG